MKKLLVLAIVAFAAVQSFAIGLGIRDGYIIGGLNGDADDYFGSGDVLTFEVLVPVNDMFGVHVGAGFEIVDYTYSKSYSSYDYESNVMYLDLSVPVMARFNFTPGFFAEAGLNLGLNFGTWSWYEEDGESSDIESMGDITNTLNVDLAVGAGYVFRFGLGLDGRFSYGLTNALESSDDYGSYKAGRYAIHIGLSYWFKKR